MSFEWSDYLKLAEALNVSPEMFGIKEASLRTVVSRAYYAAFKCALNFARDEGFQPKYNGSDHWTVRRYFGNSAQDGLRKKISVELGRLYNNRGKADYDDELRTSPESLAALTLGMAQSVLKNLKTLAE